MGKYGLRDSIASVAAYLGLNTLLGYRIGFGVKDRSSDDQSHNQALFIAAGSGDKAMIRLLSGPNYAKYISTYDYSLRSRMREIGYCRKASAQLL